MNGGMARGLVPPRPNLGPEPWREPDPRSGLVLAATIVILVVLLALWIRRRRRSRHARGNDPSTRDSITAPPGPRGRLVDLSETVRDALTAQFGRSFRARTTEELSADDRLKEWLGEDAFQELMRFLDRIDRVKFAPERPALEDAELNEILGTWEPVILALAARIRTRARQRPRAERHRRERSPR